MMESPPGYAVLRQTTITGYGAFKFQMSNLLTQTTSLQLATFFEFPPADYDAIRRSRTPGLDIVEMMDAKDIITKEDANTITDALERIDMSGIARKVGNLFARYVQKTKSVEDNLQKVQFNRGKYLYLDEDQLENEHNTKELLDILNEHARQVLDSKLQRYELRINNDAPFATTTGEGEGELRVAVIGKTGQGKSATANSILGIGAFDADDTATSVTIDPSRRSSRYEGRKIFVVDTPGLQDTDRGEERILREICSIPTLLERGVHAFVYVFNGADPRFGEADRLVLQGIQEAFGTDFSKYCLVVFTRAESTLKTKSLDAFVEKQRESSDFRYFLAQVGWRILALENSATSLAEKRRNQSSVISLIDRMVSQNKAEGRSPVYTTKMFEIAQEEKRRSKMRCKSRGWGEEVYEARVGARAALGGASRSDELYFQQMCVRLPLAYNDVLQAQKGAESALQGDRHQAKENLQEKLQTIGKDADLREELATEMTLQQKDFDSMWRKLWLLLQKVTGKVQEACVIV